MGAVKKWRCTVCGYIHEGDAPPKTCPLCGVGPELFVPEGGDQSEPAADASASQTLVIIGDGVAGTSAAEAARKQDPNLAIVLLSKEGALPYYRINLTRFLAGEIDAKSLIMHDESWYQERNIQHRQGEVMRIDRAKQRLQLSDGGDLHYDRLILASGAHPFFPPITGVTRERVWALRNMTDTQRLREFGRKGRRCVVIGGGLLGLEAAGALRQQGVQVSVVEGAPSLLPRQLAPKGGALLQGYLQKLGIQVVCGAKVEELVGDEAVQAVRLADGQILPADCVVIAAGVRPNVQLAKSAGLDVQRGLVVDAQMGTLDPDVFAAGDLAEHQGVITGLWMTAFKQGQVAGQNAAGGDARYHNDPPPQRLKVLDVDLFSIGDFSASTAGDKVFEREQDGHYLRIVCRGNKIVGANLFGEASLSGPLTKAVEQGLGPADVPKLVEALGDLSTPCA